jgi:hypothetical protein
MFVAEFVLTDNIADVKAKIAKLNKKAIKLSCPPIEVIVTDETKVVDEKDRNNRIIATYHYTKIQIVGETPKLNGWELTAVKHHDETMGLVVDSVPEKEMPVEFRTTGTACEHCNSNRRRNDTFILEKNVADLTPEEMRFI